MRLSNVILAMETVALVEEALAKVDRSLPIRTRIKLKKVRTHFLPALQEYEAERIELVKKHGTPILDKEGKDTGDKEVLEEKFTDFYKDLDPALNLEMDKGWPMLTQEEFDPIADLEVDLTDAQLASFGLLLPTD